ncbi:MAG: maltotransferase domain-containing protein, partial [Myxococcota bacterium]
MAKKKRTGRPRSGCQRVVIQSVEPEIDAGRYPIKRCVGERVQVSADLFADGHDLLAGMLLYRHAAQQDWQQAPLTDLGDDRWGADFGVEKLGRYLYTIRAWVDQFATWRDSLRKRVEAEQDVRVDLQIGAKLIAAATRRAGGAARRRLLELAKRVHAEDNEDNEDNEDDEDDEDVTSASRSARVETALSSELRRLMAAHPNRRHETSYARTLDVVVDRERARWSTWYELFPRSCSCEAGAHGTFADVEARLPHIARMGFDVVYL